MRFLFIRTQLLLAFVFFTAISFAQATAGTIGFRLSPSGPITYSVTVTSGTTPPPIYGISSGIDPCSAQPGFSQPYVLDQYPSQYKWYKSINGIGTMIFISSGKDLLNPGVVNERTVFFRVADLLDPSCGRVTSNNVVVEVASPLTGGSIGFNGNTTSTYNCGSGVIINNYGTPTGGTAPYTYVWEIKPTSSSNWVDFPSQGFSSLSSTGTLTQSTLFRRKVTDGSGASTYSNEVHYQFIVPPTAPVLQPATQTVTIGTSTYPQTITTVTPITGNNPSYFSYWEQSNSSSGPWVQANNTLFQNNFGNSLSPTNNPLTSSYPTTPTVLYLRTATYSTSIPNECQSIQTVYSTPVEIRIVTASLTGGTIGFGNVRRNTTLNCGLSSTILEATAPTSGSSPYTFVWQTKPTTSGTWNDLVGQTNSTSAVTGTVTTPSLFRRKVTDANGNIAYSNEIEYQFLAAPTPPIIQPATQTVVIGSGTRLTSLTTTTPITGSGYRDINSYWQQSNNPNGPWTNASIGSSQNFISSFSFSTSSPTLVANLNFPQVASITFYRTATYGVASDFNVPTQCEALQTVYSVPVEVRIIEQSINGGTISLNGSNTATICSGTAPALITNTSLPSNGIAPFTYTWQESFNGGSSWVDILSTNTINYQPPTLTTARSYRRKVVDANNYIGYSNIISINTTSCTTPLIAGSIVYNGNSNVCVNSTLNSFSNNVSASGGSGTLTYEWQQKSSVDNIWNSIANSNTVNYQPSPISTTTTFRRKVTDNLGATSLSNEITITIASANSLDGGNIVYDDFICFNTSLAPIQNTRGPQGGTGSHLYTWEKLINGVWTAFTNPSNTALSLSNTSANTTVFPTTGSFRRKVTDQCGNVAYSNTCIVSSQFVSAGSIQIANNTINAGQTPNVILSGFMPSAGQPEDYGPNSPLVLSWVSSTNINGPWVVIPNATNVGYQSGPLFQTTYFRRVATETICNKRDTSNVLTINVTGFLNPGSISSTQHNTTICIGTALNSIANVTAASSSSNSITYEWQYINATVGVWTNIANTNLSSFTPQPITQTTRFRRKATDGNNLVVFSNEIVINVNAVTPTLQITNGTNVTTTCSGVLTLTTNASNITSYQWQKLDNGVYVNINGADLSNYNITEPGTYRVVGTTTCGSTQIISNSCTVTITNFGLTPSVTISTNSPLSGSCENVGFLTSTRVAINNTLQWQRLINGVYVNIPFATQTIYKVQESGTYRATATTICNGVTIASNAITFTITPSGNPNEFGNGIWRFYGFDGTSGDLSQNTYKGFYDNDVPTNPNNFYTQDHWYQYNSPFAMTYDPTPFTSDWYGCSFQSNNSLTIVAKRRGFDCGNYNLWVRVSSGDRMKLIVDGNLVRETYTAASGFSNEFLSSPITLNANSTIEVWTSSSTAGTFINFEARRIGATNLVGGTITPSTQTLTMGATPALLANATNPTGGNGSSYLYQWEQSNQFIGPFTEIANATNNSLQLGALYQTTYYRRKTYQAGCSYGAYSNVATITLPQIVPIAGGTISLNGATTSICNGGTPSLISNTSNATNGTGVYTYTWQKNVSNTGWVDIASSNALNYQPLAINAATSFRRRVVDHLNNTAYSNEVSFTVTNCFVQLSGGTIAFENGDALLCPRSPLGRINNVTHATGGNLPRTYQWQQKVANSNTWFTITYATDTTYTPPPISITTSFRRMVVDEDGTIAYSNVVTINIASTGISLDGGSVVTNNFVCNANSTQLLSLVNPSGGSTNHGYTMVWEQLQGNNWVAVTNASTQAFNLNTTMLNTPVFAYTGSFRRKVTDFCNNVAYSNSGTAASVALQFIYPGSIHTSTAMIAAGVVPSLINNQLSPDAGYATQNSGLQVMWQQTTDLNGTWTVIPNSSSYTYQPPALTQTTHYRRVVRETLCGTSATSNVVSILVNSTPITLHGGVIQTSSTCVLLGNTAPAINNVTTNFGGTAPYTFEWEKNETGAWEPIANSNVATFNPGNIVTSTSFRRKITDATNASQYSNVIKLNIQYQPLKGGLIGQSTLLCPNDAGANLIEVLNACDGGGNLTYQWEYSQGNNVWNAFANSNSPNYSYTNLNMNIKVRRKVMDECGNSAYSNTIAITIYPMVVAGTLTPTEQTVCSNGSTNTSNISLINNNHYTNGTVSYQWQQSSVSANGPFTNIPNATQSFYKPVIFHQTMHYRLMVTGNICNYVSYSTAVTVTSTNSCKSITQVKTNTTKRTDKK